MIATRSKDEMLWLGFGALLTAMGLILCLACEEDKGRVRFGPWPKKAPDCTISWKRPNLKQNHPKSVSCVTYFVT